VAPDATVAPPTRAEWAAWILAAVALVATLALHLLPALLGGLLVYELVHVLAPRLRIVRLARNYGQTAAMAAGIAEARGELLITMDADRQNDPRDIAKPIAPRATN